MLTRDSLIEWAAHWVPDSPPGQRQRFSEALATELHAWTPPSKMKPSDRIDQIGYEQNCRLDRATVLYLDERESG